MHRGRNRDAQLTYLNIVFWRAAHHLRKENEIIIEQAATMAPNRIALDPLALEAVLSRLPLLAPTTRAQRLKIAQRSRLMRLRRRDVVSRNGERLEGVVGVCYGTLQMLLRCNNGARKVVKFVKANQSCGECEALLDRPCPVDIVAAEDSLIVVMPATALHNLIERDARFAGNVVRVLADKYLRLITDYDASLNQSASQRLASYLQALAQPNGTPDTWIARLPANKTTVAARLGIAKETLSRSLRELAQSGLIVVGRREIVLNDLRALSRIGLNTDKTSVEEVPSGLPARTTLATEPDLLPVAAS